MVILYCIIMLFIPANRLWSLDARLRPEIASQQLPNWCRLLLILQIEIILIWAGLVKLNPDWLRLEPLWHWLSYRGDMPLLGWMFAEPVLVAAAAYGIIALHLVGAPLLMVRRVRPYVLALYAAFHLLNHFVFDIGIFPWVTFFASLICCDPDWPRRLWARLRHIDYRPIVTSVGADPPGWHQFMTFSLLTFWLAYQLGMPMRNWFYDGDVAWNEQGHRFAWRMKLRSKRGNSMFVVRDPASGREITVDANAFLVGKQRRKMPCQPDMVLQFAHMLRDSMQQSASGGRQLEVYTRTHCSLNYRKPQLLIGETVNLAGVQRTLTGNTWITQLREPLRPAGWWALVGGRGPAAQKYLPAPRRHQPVHDDLRLPLGEAKRP